MTEFGKSEAKLVSMISKEIKGLDYCPFSGGWSIELSEDKYLYCTPFWENSEGIPLALDNGGKMKNLRTVPYVAVHSMEENAKTLTKIFKELIKEFS